MIDDPEQNRALSLTQDLEIRTLKIHFGWFITLAFLFLHLFFILFYFLFYFQPSRLRDVKEETLFDCRKFVSLTAKPRQANPKSVARTPIIMAVSISSITATLPSHWKYISEGGATIVFSYIGPPNPDFDGMVLRLRKSGVQTPVLEKQAFGTVAEEEAPDDSSIVFQETCMKRLIPSVHLPKLQSVQVEKAWLEELSRAHQKDRPLQRTASGGIDTTKSKAVLATDLVGGSGLAVEIKVWNTIIFV